MSRPELQALLELDGLSYGIGGGYWVKFTVKAISPNSHIPHGIKYSLSGRFLGGGGSPAG